MSIQAHAADGTIHEFPDGTADAVVDGAMRSYALSLTPEPAAPKAAKVAPPTPKPTILSKAAGLMANVNRGLGIGDEIAAAANTGVNLMTGKIGLRDVPGDLKRSMTGQRQVEDGFASEHPHMAAAAKGTGMALSMAAPVGPGAQAFAAGGRMTNALRGATVAGLTGAGYAAVDRGTVGERAHAAADAAKDPVVLGLGAGAGALARGAPRAERAPAPTLEQLQADRTAAYRAVDQSGVQVAPGAFNDMMETAAHALDEAGFHAGLHPKTRSMMERIGQSQEANGGYAPTLTQLDQLRQQIGRDIASSPDAGERRMGTILRNQIDDFIVHATPEQLVGGDPAAATETLRHARDLNTRVRKLESLDQLDEAAADRAASSGTGANGDNTSRQNLIRFQRNTGNLTPEEATMTRRAIRGTPIQNATRAVGRLSPEGGTVPAAASLMTGVATHGVVPAVGFVARRVADALTQRNVRQLRELIATGGEARQAIVRALDDPAYAELRDQLANDLSGQAGVQGTGRQRPPAATVEVLGPYEEPARTTSRR